MTTFPLTPEGISARLAQIEAEKKALLALRAVYSTETPAVAPVNPPVTLIEVPVEVQRTENTGSPSTEVLYAVASNPGIRLGALIDLVLSRVETTATRPRKNMANIIGQAVIKQRIEKRPSGGFYILPAGREMLG